MITKSVKTRNKEEAKKFLEEFFTIVRTKKKITLEELKRIEDESYDLP